MADAPDWTAAQEEEYTKKYLADWTVRGARAIARWMALAQAINERFPQETITWRDMLQLQNAAMLDNLEITGSKLLQLYKESVGKMDRLIEDGKDKPWE